MKASTRYAIVVAVLAFLIFVILPQLFTGPNNFDEKKNITSFKVSGLSMEPEFKHNEIVEVDKSAYTQLSLQIGDVIAFQFEHLDNPMIKRVVGIPGDIIKIEDGWLWINQEKKISSGKFNNGVWKQGESYTINQNKYFVLSDNNSIGEDSRIWGLVSKKDIIGKVASKL